MAIGGARGAAAVVGVIVFAIGLIGALGYVPGLAVSTQSGAGGALFDYTGTGYNISIVDHSALPTPTSCPTSNPNCGYNIVNVSLQTFNLNWGDGNPVVTESLGFTASHTYATKGTFTPTETLRYYECVGGLTLKTPTTGRPPPGGSCASLVSVATGTFTAGPAQCQTCGPSGTSTVVPSFVISTQTNGSATVKDNSTTVNATITGISINWGDSTSTPLSGQFGAATHHYTTNGTYNVIEVVSWKNLITNATEPAVTANGTVTISNVCSLGCHIGPSPKPATVSAFNLLTGLIMGIGLFIAILALPGPIGTRIGVGTLVAVFVSLIAWLLGGTGPI